MLKVILLCLVLAVAATEAKEPTENAKSATCIHGFFEHNKFCYGLSLNVSTSEFIFHKTEKVDYKELKEQKLCKANSELTYPNVLDATHKDIDGVVRAIEYPADLQEIVEIYVFSTGLKENECMVVHADLGKGNFEIKNDNNCDKKRYYICQYESMHTAHLIGLTPGAMTHDKQMTSTSINQASKQPTTTITTTTTTTKTTTTVKPKVNVPENSEGAKTTNNANNMQISLIYTISFIAFTLLF